MTCKNCGRELPNKDFKTKKGCYWCFVEAHKNDSKPKKVYLVYCDYGTDNSHIEKIFYDEDKAKDYIKTNAEEPSYWYEIEEQEVE